MAADAGARREPTKPLERHDADEPVRKGNVHGMIEAARMWAREQGLPVPSVGPLPPGVVAAYRRHQTWE
ncbi:hypothetical protein [Actinomycetospora cinnamomea]|uniref:Lsr2 protein n=1 Tax=Actinomycetospora cinnamomea TaxID=663609 RepID=A0A2U1EC66_9PSEU|nr:hypothetical protein [Actinomycetospora cinnamomea]PVY97475.1 hypothetical protein C8D89_12412 [Actinomycetospora cinnamomea]